MDFTFEHNEQVHLEPVNMRREEPEIVIHFKYIWTRWKGSLGLIVTNASCNREPTAKTINTNVSTRW